MTPTVAVDFDDTLYIEESDSYDRYINRQAIDVLKRFQEDGGIVILWTCRTKDTLKEAISLLREEDFKPDYINENTPEVLEKYGGDSRKIYAQAYIDDRAIFSRINWYEIEKYLKKLIDDYN